MPAIAPTVEQIEDYLEALEDLLLATVQAATPDLPRVSEAIHRLWEDVSRFGPQSMPSLPELHLPGLGTFEVPPPPPPPPPAPIESFWQHSVHWISDHPWTTAGITIGAVGTGLLIGYGYRHPHVRTVKTRSTAGHERRLVVVVLGGDSPVSLSLILELEKKGYIVITSVSTPEAVSDIERRCHGYVRALVLDPAEPETIQYFLRSLASTLSRRFPINAAGDPHAVPSALLIVHSVICLLTLPSPSTTIPPSPLECLSLHDTYTSYLQTSHIVPLQLLQAMMPLIRGSSARARDALLNGAGKKSIIVCLPATDARVGVSFASAQAMSAAATLRGVEVLRREIRMAAITDDSMKNLKVVVVDVGSVGPNTAHELDTAKATEEWTPAEKTIYGDAFSSLVEDSHYGALRKPTDVSAFVNTVVDIVSNGQKVYAPTLGGTIELVLGRLREWIRGDRVLVGAGARTYALASHLPALILDTILNIPYFLISIRNALLPVPPRIVLPDLAALSPAAPPAPAATAQPQAKTEAETPAEPGAKGEAEPEAEASAEPSASEVDSEADVESNEGSGVGVSDSWISVRDE